MAATAELEDYHKAQCAVAAQLYRDSLTPDSVNADWVLASLRARKLLRQTLRASKYLTDIPAALKASGYHLTTLRSLFAPPISQDQLKLLCADYPKTAEKSGRPSTAQQAAAVEAAFLAWRDKRLTRWLDRGTNPNRSEIEKLFHAAAPILSLQLFSTLRRNGLSSKQEGDAINRLVELGWTRKNSGLVSTLADMPAKHFMHKTRFATDTQPQEVDIACGLGATVVLAMECKVTNDETNSVKRINDVLKKAEAWQKHWAAFVRTAALLQGVIAYKDVNRLLNANIHVFWSHDLPTFENWILANIKA